MEIFCKFQVLRLQDFSGTLLAGNNFEPLRIFFNKKKHIFVKFLFEHVLCIFPIYEHSINLLYILILTHSHTHAHLCTQLINFLFTYSWLYSYSYYYYLSHSFMTINILIFYPQWDTNWMKLTLQYFLFVCIFNASFLGWKYFCVCGFYQFSCVYVDQLKLLYDYFFISNIF